MQIALQDIRTLGYKKIMLGYTDEDSSSLSFLEDLKSINILFYTMKIPAYSLLNKWKLLGNNNNLEEIRGYSLLVHNLEPMIDIAEPTASSKRKCRNTWDSIWSNFGIVNCLEDYEINLIKDFGIKLLFIFVNQCIDDESISALCNETRVSDNMLISLKHIMNFYNSVLTWSMFTQQESNFTKNDLCFIDVLNMLVVDDSTSFENNLKSLY